MRSFFFIFLFCVTAATHRAQKPGAAEYINIYKDIAIKEMHRCGIPASIILAQGMLESDYGNSSLAKRANNHFGIKCHKNWIGKKVYHDDDKKNECFRKYANPNESFRDHSNFIANGQRYQFLFDYEVTNYKAWAKGLKKAGYATNPNYDDLLIRIIEENKLYIYDSGSHKEKKHTHKTKNTPTVPVKITNNIKYVEAGEHDTYESIAKNNNMMLWEIYKYNDLPKDAKLSPGQKLYIQPKRNKAQRGYNYHIVEEGETMYTIAQKYGIKLKKLYEKNLLEPGTPIKVGDKLWLRKQKKASKDISFETQID